MRASLSCFVLTLLLLAAAIEHKAQQIRIFEVQRPGSAETPSKVFVSMSDVYGISEHPDSLALPKIEDLDRATADYFKLTPKYRRRFLHGTNVSERDSVFIYDYAKDLMVTYCVKDMPVVASINSYADDDDWPYQQFEYMIGFEINAAALNGFMNYYTHTFVCIGKTNPFTRGQMKALHWNKMEPRNFPKVNVDTAISRYLGTMPLGNACWSENEGIQFFVQEYIRNNDVSTRRLLAIDVKTKN